MAPPIEVRPQDDELDVLGRVHRPVAPPPGGDGSPTLDDVRRSPWRRLHHAVIVTMIAGIAVMWIYAFFGEVPTPARLDDRSFPIAAEPVCAAARADLERLPRAFETPTHTARADVVDRGTERLGAMVADLRAAMPADEPTRTRVDEWLDDWSIYLRDRRDYTERLRADPAAKYYSTQSDRDRRQITGALDNFAKVNTMPSCATPEDVV